jgi:hypothetical protein
MLSGEQQVNQQRVEVVGDAGDRGGVQRCPLGDEPLGSSAPSATAASPSCSIWSKIAQ